MSSIPNTQEIYSSEYQWYQSAPGRYLRRQEEPLYDHAVADLFGFNALQMGCLQMDLLRQSRIASRYRSSDFVTPGHQAHLHCSDDFLPFADASLDLLLLPHRLEFSERPHQTLREAERVIMPEGHLLISGFNPFSLWGAVYAIKNLLPNKSCPRDFPWSGRFISLTRLKDWLSLLGFEVVSVQMCCHMPPFEHKAWHRRFSFVSKLAARWLHMLGGVYFVVARKRVVCMTPLKPSWKKTSLQPRLVARPTQRGQSKNGVLKPPNKNHCEQ